MFHHFIATFAVAQLVVTWGAAEPQPAGAYCIGYQCYSIYQLSRKFSIANKICNSGNGHLMTVSSTVASDSISILMQHVRSGTKEFWIGLNLAKEKCSNNSKTLRGFEWVTGDDKTNYQNWRKPFSVCGSQCVVVANDITWEVKSCDFKAEGFLCEYSYHGMCAQLKVRDPSTSVTYVTPFGGMGPDFQVLPPGTIASLLPSGLQLNCTDKDDGTLKWKSLQSGPWDCLIENGGCEHNCLSDTGIPRCVCPDYQRLNTDGLTCSFLPTPCDSSPCSHLCAPVGNAFVCMCRDGYELADDNLTCKDIDDCRVNRNICDQVCVNTEGGFRCECNQGYKLENGLCKDIDECVDMPCEHDSCNNTDGSFICFCDEGYVVDPKDKTKCKLFCGAEKCPAKCDPNNNMECECPDGYVSEEQDDGTMMCLDINNCLDGNSCQQLCNNTFGSFICGCWDGFILQDDGSSCKPEREVEGSAETPFYTVPSVTSLSPIIPTTNYTTVDRIALSTGALLGIIAGITLTILVLIVLIHHLLKQRAKWGLSKNLKCGTELEITLQEVTAGDSCTQKAVPISEKSRLET